MTEISFLATPIGKIGVAAEEEFITKVFFKIADLPEQWQRGDQNPLLREAQAQMDAYFAGKLREFDLPLYAEMSDFSKAVLEATLEIPYGQVTTYGALARELQIHAVLLSVYNFIFLFYSFGAHVTVGYFLAAAGFAAVHAAIAVAAADSRTLESCMPRSAFSDMAPDGGGIPDMGAFSAGEHFQEKDPDMANDSTLSLKERLLGYFESEKPYLSKNLTMEEVAMRLFTNKTYLSKTINVEMNKNFRELVNYFRVKEAINIFSTNPDISMGELRDRCGFNNNASFTSAFKLNTGYTPGEWCRDVKSGRVKAINK